MKPVADYDLAIVGASFAGLPTSVSDISGAQLDTATLMRFIAQDKKVQKGALSFILTRGIGEAFVSHDVPPSAVHDFLVKTVDA